MEFPERPCRDGDPRESYPMFKAQVALAAIGRLDAGQAVPMSIPIRSCKAQLEGSAPDFGVGDGASTQPAVDLTLLHAKLGELTLDNDFLVGMLTNAGAKRWHM